MAAIDKIPNVLLVAPTPSSLPKLPWADREVQSIVNSGLHVRLERDIDDARLIEILLEDREVPFDILWFATHGGENGVYLSGDSLLTPDVAASAVIQSGVTCVVLNTCDSIHVAATISEEARVPVICTISTSIDDKQAWRTAALFANKLARGMSITEAFRLSRPVRPGKYIYLPPLNCDSKEAINQLQVAIEDGNTVEIRSILDTLEDHGERIVKLESVTQENEKRIRRNERKLSPPISVILIIASVIVGVIIDAILIDAVISDAVMWEMFLRIPLVWIGGEFLIVIGLLSWMAYAITVWRKQ